MSKPPQTPPPSPAGEGDAERDPQGAPGGDAEAKGFDEALLARRAASRPDLISEEALDDLLGGLDEPEEEGDA